MSQIYWNLHEIPRPENSYINHSDGRVFIISDIGNGKKKRTVYISPTHYHWQLQILFLKSAVPKYN